MTAYADRRSLAYAAMVSIALHALGLSLAASGPKPPRVNAHSGSPAIVARLAEAQPAPREAPKRAPRKALVNEKPLPPAPPADAASIAQFRQLFISQAARDLDYPLAALAQESEGKVLVGVSVAPHRAAADVIVKASSGHDLLDDHALGMFRRAAAELPVPPALRGQEFAFEVPVVYALRR